MIRAALYNYIGAKMTVSDCTFSGNAAAYYGGAICNLGNLIVNSSTFTSNGAEADGGAIINVGSLQCSNSTYNGNIAGMNGGAIGSEGDNATLTLNGCTFGFNVAADDGEAIYLYSNTSIANKGSKYTDNVAQLGDNFWENG